jgi:peptidoglycan/LPS O-acetylase OafA/YrhL
MQSKNVNYDPRLDHLRALAALTVLIFHARAWADGRSAIDPVAISWIDQGHVGVSLFMVISGFIFARIADTGAINVPRFYLSRVLRIYPLFIAVLAVSWFANDSQGADGHVAFAFIAFLLPMTQHLPSEASQMWSLALELQFYLIFPLLYGTLAKRGWRGYVVLFAFLLLMRFVVYAHLGTVHYFAYFTLFGALDAFVFGFVAAKIVQDRVAPPWLAPVVLVAFSAVLGAVFHGHHFFHVDYGGPDIYRRSPSPFWIVWPTAQGALDAALVASYMACRARLPGSRAIAWLGTISYSIYGWHVIVGQAVFRHFGSVPWITPYGFGLIIAAATIVVAAFSYHVIERPFLELRVRYLTQRYPARVDERVPAAAE